MLPNKFIISLTILMGILGNINAQQDNIFLELEKKEWGHGEVKIIQDPQVKELISKHIESNDKSEGIPGYRILIFSKSGNTARDEMNMAKTNFLKIYPDIRAHEDYDQVNFKVYVGDFLTMSDALRVLHAIRGSFSSAFIINTNVNYPKPD